MSRCCIRCRQCRRRVSESVPRHDQHAAAGGVISTAYRRTQHGVPAHTARRAGGVISTACRRTQRGDQCQQPPPPPPPPLPQPSRPALGAGSDAAGLIIIRLHTAARSKPGPAPTQAPLSDRLRLLLSGTGTSGRTQQPPRCANVTAGLRRRCGSV